MDSSQNTTWHLADHLPDLQQHSNLKESKFLKIQENNSRPGHHSVFKYHNWQCSPGEFIPQTFREGHWVWECYPSEGHSRDLDFKVFTKMAKVGRLRSAGAHWPLRGYLRVGFPSSHPRKFRKLRSLGFSRHQSRHKKATQTLLFWVNKKKNRFAQGVWVSPGFHLFVVCLCSLIVSSGSFPA